ncbi:MAG: type II toxin-antitoxin system HicA family toxin [Chloroflexota bacterium]|nr:type II toxin-antitoxin system HicA family toxin [Chloroflexota bacterium]
MPTVRAAIRLVERDGWYYVHTRGSHRQFRHPVKPGKVTIPGKLGDDLPKGTGSTFSDRQDSAGASDEADLCSRH